MPSLMDRIADLLLDDTCDCDECRARRGEGPNMCDCGHPIAAHDGNGRCRECAVKCTTRRKR